MTESKTRRAAMIVRSFAIVLVVAAPLAPTLFVPDRSLSVVYVVDTSQSVGTEELGVAEAQIRAASAVLASRESDLSLGVVTAGFVPEVRVPVGAPIPSAPFLPPAETPGTNLASAVRLAVASLPGSGGRRVVLLTDGRETRGDVLAEVARARAGGVEVDVVSIGSASASTLTLASVEMVEERVAEGEPVEAVAEVRGVPGTTALVRWSRRGEFVTSEQVAIGEDGIGRSRVVDQSARPGVHTYTAELQIEDPGKGPAASASGSAIALVTGKPRVLVLTLGGERPSLLVDALEHAEASVDVRSIGDFEPTTARLSAYELLVLADLPIAREGEVTLLAGLSAEGQNQVIDFVRERGGGVMVTGGAFGFGPEYAGTPLSRMLPVEIEDRGDVEDPPVALAVMLDRSGSMGAMVGEHTKLELAIEASLAAASTVRPTDSVGIASVDTVTVWHAPLGPAAGLVAQRERVRQMGLGGGGIYVYTALSDAFAVLSHAPAPIRHVILFSDSADSEEQFGGCPFAPCGAGHESAVELARTARMAGITTSVVGIGQETDTDVGFLRDLAAAAGGRFYLTSRGTDLRRIFVAETRATARSNIREEETRVRAGAPHPALLGVDVASAPPLEGFAETHRRGTADTAIETADGKPILASWRYGLGTVVALTTDAGGRWSDGWASWDGTGQLFRQVSRYAMRRRAPTAADARLTVRDETVELEVEVADDRESVPSTVELFAFGENGQEKSIEGSLERVAPGRYVLRARTHGEPYAIARVRDAHGQLLAEALGGSDARGELTEVGPDERVLAEVARTGGGAVDPTAADTLRPTRERSARACATWPFVLVLAALFVAFDLWLRRLGRPRRRGLGELAPARATLPEGAG
jgi:uncharacterized membrane protein